MEPSTDRLDADQFHVILIESGENLNGWILPEEVLQSAATLFEGAACLIDHAGWFDYPSLRDLAGTYGTIVFEGENPAHPSALAATLKLQQNAAGALLHQIFTAWLADRDAGVTVAPIGLSADLNLAFDWIDNQRVAREITYVWSVDAVLHPAAGGRVERVLNSLAGPRPPTQEGDPMPHDPLTNPTGATPRGYNPPPVEQVIRPPITPPPPPTTQAPVTQSQVPTPSPSAEILLSALSAQVTTLTDRVATLTANIAVQEAERTIQGMGDAPRTHGMRSSLDQVELAIDAMLAGTRPEGNVPPLSGVRELYHLLSGDYEMTGIYQADRVTLAAVNSSTMAGLVADALNKRVINEFQVYPQWWKPIVLEEDFANLQDVKWITLGGVGELPTVAEGASYTELTWDDVTETDAFVKKGGYLGLTLEAIDKDDTSRIRRAPRALAQAAWLTLSKSVSGIFTTASGLGPDLADATALFDAGRGNLGSTALSWAEYIVVRTAMRKQTELNSNERLGALTAPRFILVPPDLEITALQILASEGEPGKADNDENPLVMGDAHNARMAWARERVIVVDLWTDTDNWAAVADPRLYPSIGMAYRYGRQPEIFSVASPTAGLMFSNDTMPIKVRFFYAVGPTDYRGLYKENV